MADRAGTTPRIARTTRSELLYERLRSDILTGQFPPGTQLRFAGLTAQYDYSMGSLREVLQRLVEVGLVESVAQQGFRVIPVTVEDLQDLTLARLEIEVAAFRHAVADGDMGWEASVVSAHHVLERTQRTEAPNPERFAGPWSIAHTAFHQALISGCGNRRLRSTAEALRGVAELYRTWSIPFEPHKGRDTASEHRALLDAALDREAEKAAELLYRHIELTTYNLVPLLQAALAERASTTV